MNTYPQYFPLLEALRRTYSGLMTEFTIIDEKKLAKLCYDTEENIFKSLKKLEKYNILHYEPKSSQPQLIFSQNRLSNDNFELSQEYYYQIKENNKKKAEQLIDYISSNECREKQILTYFDFKAKKCGKCDVCLSNKKLIGREETIEAIYNELLQSPKSLQYFSNNINYGSKEVIIPLIRELLDEEVIILEDGLLSLKKQD